MNHFLPRLVPIALGACALAVAGAIVTRTTPRVAPPPASIKSGLAEYVAQVSQMNRMSLEQRVTVCRESGPAITRLCQALDVTATSPDKFVVADASELMGYYRQEQSIPSLLRNLAVSVPDSNTPEMRGGEVAQIALAELDLAAVRPLLNSIETEPNAQTRRSLTKVLYFALNPNNTVSLSEECLLERENACTDPVKKGHLAAALAFIRTDKDFQ